MAAPPLYAEISQSSPMHDISEPSLVVIGSNPVPPAGAVPANFGPNSQIYVCPYCHHNITTRTRAKATTKTHMMALCLFFCFCWLCCCCPYCMNSCQAINHYCPDCSAFLGTYRN